MLLDSWSLALGLLGLATLMLLGFAARTALLVLRHWNPDRDDALQIRLENQTWLASALIEHALFFQIVSLVVFVLAADHFSQVISGAMCATGALLANPFGMPALAVKMAGVFLYGFWVVLHRIDIGSETYPLLRAKYRLLVALVPILAMDLVLQTLYLANLTPDIITSCCAVVFGAGQGRTSNLLGVAPQSLVLPGYLGLAMILAVGTIRIDAIDRAWASLGMAGLWAGFLILSLLATTTVFSSYIYAMPFHRCPFCILKAEYGRIGFLLYGTLFVATFLGGGGAVVGGVIRTSALVPGTRRFRTTAARLATFFLLVHVIVSLWHLVAYRLLGGEF